MEIHQDRWLKKRVKNKSIYHERRENAKTLQNRYKFDSNALARARC
jgi:hypothetical protein